MTQPSTANRTTDPSYLTYQYGDSEKLRIRLEAHERYSERPQDGWHERHVALFGLAPGETVLDVGCGFGAFHPSLCATGAKVLAFDYSPGMAAESRRSAEHASLAVQVFRGDAQAIPLPDNSVDHALSSHMLYHVPDIAQALREMKRVVKVGGRVVITTNATDHSKRLNDLHDRAARDVGLTATELVGPERFALEHLPLVQSVFPVVTLHREPNAFIFPTAEAALRYYASGRIDSVEERQADGGHRPPLLQRMSALLEGIVAREGVIRVSKDAGSFVATVEA